jgi:flagellar biosynthetic protein FlhB
MARGSDNRSERPTHRRLQKAREKGQIARSREVPAAAVLLGVLVTLFYFGRIVLQTLEYEMQHLLNFRVPADLTNSYLSGVMNSVAMRVSAVVIPILLAAFVFAVAANLMQGGIVFSAGSLGFHLDRLNPANGLSKVFSKNGLVELAKSLLMLVAVSAISYQVVSKYIPLYPRMVLMDVRKIVHWTAYISYEVFIRVAVLLVILAVFDYFFQKYRFTEQLKMTKQEVKEEFKETEGDPITKARIRRIQREMARKRMMADVPTADVVITNPTHYAVALSYKMDSMDAPKVVAKGVGFLALKIKELAQEHGIPLVENKPLAQTLYKSVEIGEYIPGNLYRAVAEILAYVYKARSAFVR